MNRNLLDKTIPTYRDLLILASSQVSTDDKIEMLLRLPSQNVTTLLQIAIKSEDRDLIEAILTSHHLWDVNLSQYIYPMIRPATMSYLIYSGKFDLTNRLYQVGFTKLRRKDSLEQLLNLLSNRGVVWTTCQREKFFKKNPTIIRAIGKMDVYLNFFGTSGIPKKFIKKILPKPGYLQQKLIEINPL